MNTTFKTAGAAAAALAGDQSIEQRVDNEVIRGQFVSALIDLRIQKNKNQSDVAESMDCDPSTISRLESGNDISLSQIMGYLGALNLGMTVVFEDPNMPAANRIKACVFEIQQHLERLVKIAQRMDGNDDEIVRKIHEFCGDVLFNFLVRYGASVNKLPAIEIPPPEPKSVLQQQTEEDEAGKKCEIVPMPSCPDAVETTLS